MRLKLDRQTVDRVANVVNRVNGSVALQADPTGLLDRVEQSWRGEIRVSVAATITERERGRARLAVNARLTYHLQVISLRSRDDCRIDTHSRLLWIRTFFTTPI